MQLDRRLSLLFVLLLACGLGGATATAAPPEAAAAELRGGPGLDPDRGPRPPEREAPPPAAPGGGGDPGGGGGPEPGEPGGPGTPAPPEPPPAPPAPPGDDGEDGGDDPTAGGSEVVPGIHRLDGSDPNLPRQDLAPLGRMIGDASVVALGEVVHTSGGFYEMKDRVFRYLVEELGFRAFGFESAWDDAMRLTAEYVATCAGSAEEATLGLYGVWQSREVADLLAWMCDWNRRHPHDPVIFFGFDIQQAPFDRDALLEHFLSFGLASTDSRLVGLRHCQPFGFGTRPSPHENLACLSALDALEPEFPALAERAGLPPWERALGRLRFVSLRHQILSLHLLSDRWESFAARDAGMARVFFGMRDLVAPGKRTALWAHNFHIGNMAPLGFRSMGMHLDEVLGEGYVSLGLIAYRRMIDWPDRGCGEDRGIYRGDAVERLLRDLGHPYLLVDLDFPGTDKPFLSPLAQYSIDNGLLVPRAHWDGLVFLETSRPMTPLFRPPCG